MLLKKLQISLTMPKTRLTMLLMKLKVSLTMPKTWLKILLKKLKIFLMLLLLLLPLFNQVLKMLETLSLTRLMMCLMKSHRGFLVGGLQRSPKRSVRKSLLPLTLKMVALKTQQIPQSCRPS
jgi:hypothetical protein